MERAPRPENTPSNHLDKYPSPEDWIALQGGKPRVFRHRRKANVPWRVVHVYEDHPDAEHRFQSGAIVDTTPPEKLTLLNKGVYRTDPETGQTAIRDIVVPSFMDRTVHGDVCEGRSGYQGYDRITNQPDYERYLAQMQREGWQEIRFGVGPTGFTLTVQPEIKDSRPLS